MPFQSVGTPKWGTTPQTGTSDFYIISPEGKQLYWQSFAYTKPTDECYAGDAGTLSAYLEKKIKEISDVKPRGDVKVRPPMAERGAGIREDGATRFAVTVRTPAWKEVSGSEHIRNASVVLSSAERATLVPPRMKKGARYSIPEATARHFVAACAYNALTVAPEHAAKARLEGEVVDETAGRVEVSVTGELQMRYPAGGEVSMSGEGTIEGRLVFNPKGELQSLLMVYDGTIVGGYFGSLNGPVKGLIEWRLRPEDETRPGKGSPPRPAPGRNSK